MSVTTDRAKAFADFLAGLAERGDRAALPALRRGLGKSPAEAGEAHRHVVPWLREADSRGVEDAFYLVASLFAWHPMSWPASNGPRDARNLGTSLHQLATNERRESVERRFTALLNCHAEDLPAHLRQIVGLLRTHEVPVDWAALLRDVQRWDREGKPVQRAWARAFWAQTTQMDSNADLQTIDGPDVTDSGSN